MTAVSVLCWTRCGESRLHRPWAEEEISCTSDNIPWCSGTCTGECRLIGDTVQVADALSDDMLGDWLELLSKRIVKQNWQAKEAESHLFALLLLCLPTVHELMARYCAAKDIWQDGVLGVLELDDAIQTLPVQLHGAVVSSLMKPSGRNICLYSLNMSPLLAASLIESQLITDTQLHSMDLQFEQAEGSVAILAHAIASHRSLTSLKLSLGLCEGFRGAFTVPEPAGSSPAQAHLAGALG